MAASTALRCWRCAALAAALAWSAGCAFLPSAARAQPQADAAVATPGPRWGHELGQIAPDPAVRFGRLSNGLRYALQHNETPADGVAMRLRIGAGSLRERDGEEGLAHFLEHMAFRGSANVADGAVVRLLQQQGLAYGPDTNAFTDHNQTVYQFNFPRADAASLDAGLLLFREIGERLTLDRQLIEQEKGVVLSEARLRDVPAQRAEMAELSNTWAGTLVPRRWPIGQVATIQAATAEKLRRYYRANYRPDNATLVVVGRIDVDAVERQIRERFADWHGNGQADPLDIGAVQGAMPGAEFAGEGVEEMLSLTWLPLPAAWPSSLTADRERLATQAALAVLNSKLTERARQPASPYLGARAWRDGPRARLTLYTQPDRWGDALDAVLEELRRLLEQGVQTADLQNELPSLRAGLKAAAQPTASRASAAIADALVSAAASEGVYTGPAQDWAVAEPVLASLEAREASGALRRSFAGMPLVFRSTASEPAGIPAIIRQLAVAVSRPLPERTPLPGTDWQSTIDFGAPSEVVSRVADAELGTTRVEFANGTRLLVKPTAQDKGRVSIQVLLGQGLSGIPRDRCHALWALGYAPFGGTSNRRTAPVGLLGVNAHAFVLQSDWTPGFPQAQLNELANFVRDAAFRDELADRLASTGAVLVRQVEAQAGSVFQRELALVMGGNEPCQASLPSAADVGATRLADLPAVLGPALSSAVDVVIVGDLTVDEAMVATRVSFGAGPARPRLPRLPLRVLPPSPGGAPHVVMHRGRDDQAMLGQAWPMPDFWADPELGATGLVAAAVLQARLVDQVRETLGITYSPSVRSESSIEVQGQGTFVVQLETPPENFATLRPLLAAELHALADTPVSADELQRAKQPLIELIRSAPQLSAYWIAMLPRVLADDRIRGGILGASASLQAVDATRIQAYFRDHIARRPPIEVQARAASPPPAPTPSAP